MLLLLLLLLLHGPGRQQGRFLRLFHQHRPLFRDRKHLIEFRGSAEAVTRTATESSLAV